jgi:filamentous hemagglutinin family protein
MKTRMSGKPLISLNFLVTQRFIGRLLTGLAAFFLSFSALANPAVDHISSGNVSIQQTNSTTTINQTSQRGVINWKSFNIGASEHTHFQQPAGGSTLNRISPTMGASSIYGKLTATGQIILVNPAGIYFGPSAFVNVGGLIATTHNITDANYLNGNYVFTKVDPYSGAIINEGTIGCPFRY